MQLSWLSCDSYMKHPVHCHSGVVTLLVYTSQLLLLFWVCVHNCMCVMSLCCSVCYSFLWRVDAHNVAVQRWRSWLVQN